MEQHCKIVSQGPVSYGFMGWVSVSYSVPPQGEKQYLCLCADETYCVLVRSTNEDWINADGVPVVAWTRIPSVGDPKDWIATWENVIALDHNHIAIRKNSMVYTPEATNPSGFGFRIQTAEELQPAKRYFVNRNQMLQHCGDEFNCQWRASNGC